jgi:hypothetical protein
VKLKDLLAEAAWLEKIDSGECPWPIKTARDLSEYAYSVLYDEHADPTRSEIRRIRELIERLKPPAERARLARSAKRRAKKEMADGLTPLDRAIRLANLAEEKKAAGRRKVAALADCWGSRKNEKQQARRYNFSLGQVTRSAVA